MTRRGAVRANGRSPGDLLQVLRARDHAAKDVRKRFDKRIRWFWPVAWKVRVLGGLGRAGKVQAIRPIQILNQGGCVAERRRQFAPVTASAARESVTCRAAPTLRPLPRSGRCTMPWSQCTGLSLQKFMILKSIVGCARRAAARRPRRSREDDRVRPWLVASRTLFADLPLFGEFPSDPVLRAPLRYDPV
jgi:hypothetical protein